MVGILVVLLFGALLGLIWFGSYASKAEKERAARATEQSEVVRLAERAQAELAKVNNLKTSTGQANACGRALGYLTAAEEYPSCREIISNYDELVARVKAVRKVLPVVGHIEKAYRHRFKGKDAAEKNALLDALYEIQTYRITDEEIALAEVMPGGTGEIVEIAGIRQRLRELGWEE